jgi:hypothetical protein
VRAVIDEDEREVADVVRTSKTSLDAITTVVTAMAVARFLRDGSEAAKRAVSAFKQLGVRELRIGRMVLSDDSPMIVTGEKLAFQIESILESVNVPEHILKNESLGGAALLLRTHIRNG